MNISEASAVSCVLSWITGRPGPAGPITTEQARADAAFLAERAYKALSAGIRPDDVRANWPDTDPAPAKGNR